MSAAAPIGRLMSVVVDCADPEVSSRFWQELLGYVRRYADAGAGGTDWITIEPAEGTATRSRSSASTGSDRRPGRRARRRSSCIFDVEVADLAVADERVLATGACPLADIVVHEDETFRVYADPDGHPFCLVQR